METPKILENAQNIRSVIRYLKRFKNTTFVIHLPDSILESSVFLNHISDIALIHNAGIRIVLVAGAKKRINSLLESAGILWQEKDGLRVSGENAMPHIKMASFDVANSIMTALAAEKISAVIGNWVKARGKGIIDGFDYESCGEIDQVDLPSIHSVLENNFIPIFPCLGWSSSGRPYNISSIDLAKEIAIQLKSEKLFFLNDYELEEIFLEKKAHENESINALSVQNLEAILKENRAIPIHAARLLNLALEACKKGLERVHLIDQRIDGVILNELFSELGSGLMIYDDNYGAIRSMDLEDVADVLSLMRPFVKKGILLERSEVQLKELHGDFVVYEIDGAIRACAALHVYGEEQGEIAAVVVDERYNKAGIGIKLIEFLKKKARGLGIASLFVLTTQTADWFEKQGFKPDILESIPFAKQEKIDKNRKSKVFRLELV